MSSAREWLSAFMKNAGPEGVDVKDIMAAGSKAGYGRRRLEGARDDLGLIVSRGGRNGRGSARWVVGNRDTSMTDAEKKACAVATRRAKASGLAHEWDSADSWERLKAATKEAEAARRAFCPHCRVFAYVRPRAGAEWEVMVSHDEACVTRR